MGQSAAPPERVLERTGAFHSEIDPDGRRPGYGEIAVAAIVGNEDGAHFSSAQLFQPLNDVGWTIPAVAACCWVGEAMRSVDFKDLDRTPDVVTKTAKPPPHSWRWPSALLPPGSLKASTQPGHAEINYAVTRLTAVGLAAGSPDVFARLSSSVFRPTI